MRTFRPAYSGVINVMSKKGPGGSAQMATRDQDVTHSGGAGPGVLLREGACGSPVVEVEPGGAEFSPLSERHGRPLQLFWPWTSPNMEFATVFVGFIGVVFFGLSFWATFLAIVIGTTL